MARTRVDWSLVPDETWRTRTNVALARELGVSENAVLVARKRLGAPASPGTPARPPAVDAHSISPGAWATRSDTELAHELGVSKTTVARARRRLGAPPSPTPRGPSFKIDTDTISPEAWATYSDAELARQLGVGATTVGTARKRLGAPLSPRSPEHLLTIEERAIPPDVWASHTDHALARKLGVRPSAVTVARRRLEAPPGPPPRRGGRRRKINARTLPLEAWATRTNGDIARELGVSENAVLEARHRLGAPPSPGAPARPRAIDEHTLRPEAWATHSDVELARQLGVAATTVGKARKRLGAPPSPAHREPRGPRPKIDEHTLPPEAWATHTDAEIALQLGVGETTVGKARKRLGAPPSPGNPAQRPAINEHTVTTATWATRTDAQLARELGLHRSTVAKWRAQLGAPAAPGSRARRPTIDERTLPPEAWATRTDAEIARELGVSETTVRNARKRLGASPSPKANRGRRR